ncbi:Signal transduction histidine kinase [Paenibacillus uliginis N3/975]|uniref:histidine kinase n=1 Tax=Paenibacillus uliginis N3/975 TaxID=1313296 RepID=A0A1X7HUL8_9BACL|nr:HAMP domain-containing sensor histidine kinase [Paenibacillus uliginis]SMF92881.1 Signal transduction histidine kinase [Paenibacillus uliginis N3/975]
MKNKTYIWTLVLFLLIINVGIMMFSIVNTKHNLSGLKGSYLREQNFLVNSMTKDIVAMKNKGYETDTAIAHSYDSYAMQYEVQRIYLQMYKDKARIYSSLPIEVTLSDKEMHEEKETTEITVVTLNGSKYMQISGYLPEPYSQYALVYYADITDTVNEWQKMNNSLFITGIIFSGVLSICLYILLEYLFEPLERISSISNQIANGEYKEKLEIRGGEEIAKVVQSFNTMADKIQFQMEELENHAREKQRLIDDLAHELRTPLTAIYGYAEYMQKTHLSEEDKYAATDYILSESKRLKNISESLLELVIIREEKEIEMVQIEIEQLFTKIHQTENIKLKEKGIEFVYYNELKKIEGNEDLIESMVLNLVDNAINACSTEGKITMRAYVEQEKKIIEVEDNGKGMTEKQLLQVTEAFYRIDKARSRKEGGTGLGLALCAQIAKKHHAELSFSSIPNEKTVVKVTF